MQRVARGAARALAVLPGPSAGKAKVSAVVSGSQPARDALVGYYLTKKRLPKSLESAGIAPQLADGSSLSLDPSHMVLTVSTKAGELVFTPVVDDEGGISWSCKNGKGLKPAQLPPSCVE